MKIDSVTDTDQAERYMRAELSDGTTLARLTLQAIDFSKGRFRVALPMGFDGSQSLELRHQDLHLDGDEPMALARLIKAFIAAPGHAVLTQDYEASLSDPWLRECEYKRLVRAHGTELYWAIAGAELAQVSDDEMDTIVNWASFHPFSCFFYLCSFPSTETALGAQELNRIVHSLVGVAVGAFDDRSFLMWWRDDLVPFPL